MSMGLGQHDRRSAEIVSSLKLGFYSLCFDRTGRRTAKGNNRLTCRLQMATEKPLIDFDCFTHMRSTGS